MNNENKRNKIWNINPKELGKASADHGEIGLIVMSLGWLNDADTSRAEKAGELVCQRVSSRAASTHHEVEFYGFCHRSYQSNNRTSEALIRVSISCFGFYLNLQRNVPDSRILWNVEWKSFRLEELTPVRRCRYMKETEDFNSRYPYLNANSERVERACGISSTNAILLKIGRMTPRDRRLRKVLLIYLQKSWKCHFSNEYFS